MPVVYKNYVIKQSESLLNSSFKPVKCSSDLRSVVTASRMDDCSSDIVSCLADYSRQASGSKSVSTVLTVMLHNATFSWNRPLISFSPRVGLGTFKRPHRRGVAFSHRTDHRLNMTTEFSDIGLHTNAKSKHTEQSTVLLAPVSPVYSVTIFTPCCIKKNQTIHTSGMWIITRTAR